MAATRGGDSVTAASGAHCAASRAWLRPRATSRNTSSSVCAAVTDEQPRRRVIVLDAAALHDDDALAQALDLRHVVGSEQHGGAALLAEALESFAHPVRGIGIERCRRLVEQQHLGRVDQRLGERDAGLLSGRELAHRPVEKLDEVEFLAKLGDAAGEIRYGVEPPEHIEILPHRQPVRHVDIGALEIHPVQHAVALARHRRAHHLDRARARHHQAEDDGKRGGLAGAVAAQQPRDRAVRQCKRNAIDCARGLVDLDQLVDGNGRGGGYGHRAGAFTKPRCGKAAGARQGASFRLARRPAASRMAFAAV